MNSTERMTATIKGLPLDRIMLRERYWDETIIRWMDEGYPVEDSPKGRVPADPVAQFGLDIWPVNVWFDNKPIANYREILDQNDDWIIARDGAGAVLRTWKKRSGAPEHLEFSIHDRDVWEEKYRSHLLNLDISRMDIEATRNGLEKYKKMGVSPYYGNTFIWDTLRQCLGDIVMFENLILEPDWISDMVNTYTDFYITHYRYLFEKAGLPDSVWVFDDLGFRSGLFCSPKILEELFLPCYRRFNDFIHGYGIPVVLHSCGNIRAALPMILQADFDGLNPLEVKAECDVFTFDRLCEGELAFFGGMDVRLFECGDRSRIKREIAELLERVKAEGVRYAFCSDHSISNDVSYQDYLYALEVYREHCYY